MSMTAEESRLHEEYENAHPLVKQVVDAGWEAIRDRMKLEGMTVAGDDRAEKLVVAIYKFVVDSAE
jgi:hypothetical protein